MTTTRPALSLVLFALGATSGGVLAAPRDVQFREVNLASAVVEIHNFGATPMDLTDWQFCTHDFDQQRRYSGDLNGISIAPGASIFIHWNNDAPAIAGHYNTVSIGGSYATPLNSAAYALELFYPGDDGVLNFGSTTDMVDHMQWAVDPNSVGQASARSVQAAAAGLWTASTAYITVGVNSGVIVLTDETGGELHGPNNYLVDPSDCPADLNDDGFVDNGDIGAFVELFLAGNLAADFNGDGFLDNGDISTFIGAFLAGC